MTTYAAWGVSWTAARTRFYVNRLVYEGGKFDRVEYLLNKRGMVRQFYKLDKAKSAADSLNAPPAAL